jgi:prepilin-type N-terminal cleavage/methylation domain-containing protein
MKPSPHLIVRYPRRSILCRAGGFTLVEVMFTCAIGSVIALAAMLGMVEGSQLFRSNSTEMVARDKGAAAIREISVDMQGASTVQIFPNYLSTTGSTATYGSCAVLNTMRGIVAYYIYPLPSSTTLSTGATLPSPCGLYFCGTANIGPNPATDKLLVSNVQDFEFRSDVNGSIRAAFKIGVYGFPNLYLGAQEPDIVRYSTSNLPRNL